MKNLNWFQARTFARQGKGVRREDWRRWLVFDAFSYVFDEIVPDAPSEPNAIRVAQSVSAGDAETPPLNLFTFAREDFLALDWTDEPWSGGGAPPAVPPYETPVGTGSGGGASGGGGFGHGDDGEIPSFGISGGGGGNGGGGARPPRRPHNPPAQAASIIITFQTDLVPDGAACLMPDQSGGGITCLVVMTVRIVGGPAGIFGLHIQLGAESKPAENGHTGYVRDFAFHPTVNPGAHLTPNVIYHVTGGDVTQNTPNFEFGAACHLAAFAQNGGAGFMGLQGANAPTALRANTFTREGYTFAGWNTEAGGGGTAYADEATYPFAAADATLYAQWEADPPPPIYGCTDPSATNYNPSATVDDGSCTYG